MGTEGAVCKQRDLTEQWLRGLRVNHVAHIRASAWYEQLHQILGLAAALVSTVVASNTWASISSISKNNPTLELVVGMLSIAVPVLTTATAFLKPAELAEKHRAASVGYGELRRELEMVCKYHADSPDKIAQCMETIRVQWSDLDKKSPLISQAMWDRIAKQLHMAEATAIRQAAGGNGVSHDDPSKGMDS
jgi:hypothetical protein